MMGGAEKIKVGISIGDLNGVGMEVILKTFKDSRMMDFCTPIVFGSTKVASIHRKAVELQDFTFHTINNISDAKANKVNLLNCWSSWFFQNWKKLYDWRASCYLRTS